MNPFHHNNPRLPQVLPAKVAAAEFALVLAVMACAIVTAAFQVTVIDMRVKAFASGIAVLLVSNCAKWHALVFARLLVAQNGVVFLAADFGALKSDKRVFFRSVNNHLFNKSCIYYAFT